MALLLALVGFAAVVAVYSTIVSVVVEGIHKMFALRSAGMSEMLRNFYDQKLANLQSNDTPPEQSAPGATGSHVASADSRNFAHSMTRRAASENLRPWYIRRWPLIGQILSSRVQKMSTLQFIERLAETPEGQALARHDRPRLRRALTAAAYEFERIGEAQTEYFRSRANMVSVLAGIAVAFFVNLDAITLYKELATNATLSARLSTLAESSSFQQAQNLTEEGATTQISAALNSPDLQGLKTTFLDMGVPVGRKMFPYCEGFVVASEADAETYRDTRCNVELERGEAKTVSWQQSYGDYLQASSSSHSIGTLAGHVSNRGVAIWNNPGTFTMWLVGILIGGGLLGLGAPFWFRLFARGAAIVAPMARLTLSSPVPGSSKPQAEVTATVPAHRLGAVRRPLDLRPAELERAYLTVLGRGTEVELSEEEDAWSDQHREPPPGRVIGTLPPEVAPK
ncbi:MAG: hypothetical protein AAFX86_01285 [Pseudomonadota bacterium]